MLRIKNLFSASVCNSLLPDGTTIGFDESPLISIETSPELTNWLRAAIIIPTKRRTTPVKERTPKK